MNLQKQEIIINHMLLCHPKSQQRPRKLTPWSQKETQLSSSITGFVRKTNKYSHHEVQIMEKNVILQSGESQSLKTIIPDRAQ